MAEIRVSTKTASHATAAGASPLSLVPAGAGGQIVANDEITASAEPGARPERRRHVENPTIVRCMKAWNYAYRKEAENLDDDESDYPAQKAGNEAYLRAIPHLDCYPNICDFIACISFASMTDIVTHSEAEHYLANARLALASLSLPPKRQSMGTKSYGNPPAASPSEAVDDGEKTRGSDFIHSETRIMRVTPLSSTKLPQNPPRFFAFFIDFLRFFAQNGPNQTQN
jgi:hypothetical protein